MEEANYLIECVPNISEGRNVSKIYKIIDQIKTEKVKIADVDIGRDANRTVITIIGRVDSVIAAVEKLYQAASEIIDMSTHHGEHPRLGAVDICPFIPFQIKNRESLISKINELAERVSNVQGIPVFLYALSATNKRNLSLPAIRKGQYEELVSDNSKMTQKADFGKDRINRKFGGTVMGVRDFMVAYNINLDTANLEEAKAIAKEMRSIRNIEGKYNSRDIKPLQILGWYIKEYGCCQISTNIHNPRDLSIFDVYSFTSEAAKRFGCKTTSSELIGMIPDFALELAVQGLREKNVKNSIDQYLGLDFKGDFDLAKKALSSS